MNIIKKLKIINYLTTQFGLNFFGLLTFFKFPIFIYNIFLFIFKGGKINNIIPIINENSDSAGSIEGHYFIMDLLVAKYIYEDNPTIHLDIGSRIDGFIGHIAIFIEQIVILDIRELNLNYFKNIKFIRGDLLKYSSNIKYKSISSLHMIEHIGLGRYGDKINPNGHIDGIKKISSLLEKNGKLYLAIPIGKESVSFNAHRVFDYNKTLIILNDIQLDVIKFDFITTNGHLIINANANDVVGETYGCGIFICLKR